MKFVRIFVVIFIALLGIVWFAYRGLQSYAAEKILAALEMEATRSGYSFSAKSAKVFPVGMYMEEISLIPPPSKFPVPIKIDTLEIKSLLEPLLSKLVHISIDAMMYEGSLQGNAELSEDFQILTIKGAAKELNLAIHPLIAIVGIERARVSIRTPSITIASGKAPRGLVQIEILEFKKPSPTVLPDGVRIPPIEALQGRASLTAKEGLYELTDVSITSSLGSITSPFLRVDLVKPKERSRLSGSVDVELSSVGDQEFSQWIKLFFPDQSYSSSFLLTLEGTLGRPNIKMTAR